MTITSPCVIDATLPRPSTALSCFRVYLDVVFLSTGSTITSLSLMQYLLRMLMLGTVIVGIG